MPPKKNPLGLNALQLRTLALAQVVAAEPGLSQKDPATGAVTLLQVPHPHGDHVHVGRFTVSARDASGFANPAVWVALARKGLARIDGTGALVITAEGLAYDTGLGERFAQATDH
jgi:hypothetical protein